MRTMTLRKVREREEELRRRLARSGTDAARRIQKHLDQFAALAALLLPPIEHEEGRLVLYRDTEGDPTDLCPFCGDRHTHGEGDGHRVLHCVVRGATVVAADGTLLRQDDGYIVRTRACTTNSRT